MRKKYLIALIMTIMVMFSISSTALAEYEFGTMFFAEPPTCTAPGYIAYYNDNELIVEEITKNPLGHSWGDWEYTNISGIDIKRHTCQRCGWTDTFIVSQTVYEVENVAETCETTGYKRYIVDKVEIGRTETSPELLHTYGKANIKKNGDEIIETRYCLRCGKSKTTQRSNRVENIEPTCMNYGYIAKYEGGVLIDKDITDPPLGHSWSEWKTKTKATCTKRGVDERKCERCGKTETKKSKNLGHEWSKWEITKEATCTKRGTSERKCSKCGKTEKKYSKSLGHKWGNWKTKKEASYTEDGIKEKECIRCNKIKTKSLPKLKFEIKANGLKKNTLKIKKGDSVKLKIKASKQVTFKSKNKKIASVSKDGKIKARKKGKTTIVVKAGKKTKKIKIIVN